VRSTRHCRGSGGFTLIELTVVLAVIVTLALVLTPSITNFISDSRVARTRTDTQTVASAIVQFYKDTGFFPQWSQASGGGPGGSGDKVDLLISAGNTPSVSAATTWTTGTTGALIGQLMSNTPGYTLKNTTAQFGWNGPYLSSTIGADAWSNRYAVNIGLIDLTAGTQTAAGGTKSAVWVISAGPNGQIETAYSQPVTTGLVSGDDIAVRVQ
jgi:prepilin-type N-terminal cleavage/methylation domain-containing protein